MFICLQLACIFLQGQSLSGWWTGAITRDFSNQTRTDSISFYLEQQGNKISGYSLLHVDSIHFIKAGITGVYISSNKMLRLTETSVLEMNIPGRGDEIFLDNYLFNFDEREINELTGKSITRDSRQQYARSKIILRRK
jgi:hypothetical protein